jgi:uncharacterized membrane protein HdeD (DUF308 family)
MTNNNNGLDIALTASLKKQLKQNADWFLLLGIGLVILGTLALLFSYKSTLFTVMYLGILLTIMGFFEGIKAFKLSQWSSFFLHLFLAVLYIISGVFITSNPLVNAITLTLLLSIFFVVTGILRIIFAFAKHVVHKNWMILNGVITTVLGLLIWAQWPVSGLWVIGMFVGIDAIFTGWTWIMLSLAAKKISA